MSTPPYDHVITENLQTSAELILQKPQEEWSAWVQFLLTELESNLEAEQTTALLQDVQSLIGQRLATGSWQ